MPKNGIITVFYAKNIIISVKNGDLKLKTGHLKEYRFRKRFIFTMKSMKYMKFLFFLH